MGRPIKEVHVNSLQKCKDCSCQISAYVNNEANPYCEYHRDLCEVAYRICNEKK